jgi:hypothetical protein
MPRAFVWVGACLNLIGILIPASIDIFKLGAVTSFCSSQWSGWALWKEVAIWFVFPYQRARSFAFIFMQ